MIQRKRQEMETDQQKKGWRKETGSCRPSCQTKFLIKIIYACCKWTDMNDNLYFQLNFFTVLNQDFFHRLINHTQNWNDTKLTPGSSSRQSTPVVLGWLGAGSLKNIFSEFFQFWFQPDSQTFESDGDSGQQKNFRLRFSSPNDFCDAVPIQSRVS